MNKLIIINLNLQQGLLFTDITNGSPVAVFARNSKTIYSKFPVATFSANFDLPQDMQDFKVVYEYDSFSLAGWDIQAGKTKIV